ncbi:MAG: SusC/RagA family TonB-linked outer membrane protein, partial [Muribaculaceae bacterium]|nr:SusC/RagA family TonB-linked outer membrane protein [Muribaculaceae bacterium]
KDAASSAIYGSRAAFGVILVTTKQGSVQSRVNVNYSNNFGWSRATVLPEFASTVDVLEMGLADANTTGEVFGMNYADVLPYARLWQQQHNGKPYKDFVELKPYQNEANVGDYAIVNNVWLRYADWNVGDVMFSKHAFSQKHNVSIDGNNGKTNYRLSFSYDDRESLLKVVPDKLKRYTANATIDTQIFPWFKAGTRLAFSQRDFEGVPLYFGSYSMYQYTWRWPAFFNTYGYTVDPDSGDRTYVRTELARRYLMNPRTNTNSKFSGQAYFLANLGKYINLQGDFTYSIMNGSSNQSGIPAYMWNTWTTTPFVSFTNYTDTNSYVGVGNTRDTNWTANVFATFDKTFNEKHNLKVMVGWTAEREAYNYTYAERTGVIDPSMPNLNLTAGDTYSVSANTWKRATTGFFGRINYSYNDIWLLEANGRYDGSSRFPSNDQWAFFPSASAGYRFSQENYFEELRNSWWNNGKIRFSYGQVGNEAVGSNRFLSTVSRTTVGWLNAGGNNQLTSFTAPTAVSSSLTWERIETIDAGIDLGFLNNSLNFGFDWYQRDTKDMLAPGVTLPGVFGATTPYQNAGSLRTRGWEFSVMWNHRFGDVNVYANFMLSDSQTKITKWNNPSGQIYTYLPASGNYTEGQNFGDIWGFETDRYFTVDDFTWDTADGKWQSGATATGYANGVPSQAALEGSPFFFGPGDVKFKDLNGDGVINGGKGTVDDHGDLKVIGNALPRYEYSFRVGGDWKGFDLDVFFQGVGKRNMWATGSTIILQGNSNIAVYSNQLSYNETVYEGRALMSHNIDQSNMYPRLFSGSTGAGGTIQNIGYGRYNYYPQSRYLLNLAYLRVKNLTIGYTLPRSLTEKALIKKARLYFSADNLGFIYAPARKYQLDPEMTTSFTNSGSNTTAATQIGFNDSLGGYGRTTPISATYSFGIQVTF